MIKTYEKAVRVTFARAAADKPGLSKAVRRYFKRRGQQYPYVADILKQPTKK